MCMIDRPVSDLPVRHSLHSYPCKVVVTSNNPALFRERFQKIADSVDSNFDTEVKIMDEFKVDCKFTIPNDTAFVLQFETEMGGSPHVAIGEFFKQMEAV